MSACGGCCLRLEERRVDAGLNHVDRPVQAAGVESCERLSIGMDDLQEAIALLRSKDFGVELKFGNYR